MKHLYCRIPAALKPYLPNMDIGLRAILTEWHFPSPPHDARIKCHTRIPDDWQRQIADIAQQSGKTKNTVIVAALHIAATSSFNPRPEIPRDAPRKMGRPPQRAKSAPAAI